MGLKKLTCVAGAGCPQVLLRWEPHPPQLPGVEAVPLGVVLILCSPRGAPCLSPPLQPQIPDLDPASVPRTSKIRFLVSVS